MKGRRWRLLTALTVFVATAAFTSHPAPARAAPARPASFGALATPHPLAFAARWVAARFALDAVAPVAGRPTTPGAPPAAAASAMVALAAPVTLAAPVPQPVVVPGGRLAPVYYRVPTSQPVVFLTIDDGWVRDPRLPALLTALHVPVTIFLIRQAAAADVGYFRALRAAGATIEDHTLTHPFLTRLSAGAQSIQICGGADALAAWYGSRPTLVRPPYGALNAATQAAAAACGLKAVVQWSASMYHGVLTVPGNRLHPGDIVILHFNDRLVPDLQQVVTMAAQSGLAVGRLESYLS